MNNFDWFIPENVGIAMTNRHGGLSNFPFDSLNLGCHVGDDNEKVLANRSLLKQQFNLPSDPIWLSQVHGTDVVDLSAITLSSLKPIEADGSYTNQAGQVCAVMTADCLPVLLCDKQGTQVSAVHAGWRGLCNGIIEQGVNKFSTHANQLIAYLGAAIGAEAFEVGSEVKAAFTSKNAEAKKAFKLQKNGKYLADIYLLAIQRLHKLGVTEIYQSTHCTYSNSDYFSYRRDGKTGRQASLIWIK
ncbi:MAG: peptidoglycan editing factor PgeF [Parashewanella sp.]